MIELPEDMKICWDWYKELFTEEAKLEPLLKEITAKFKKCQEQRLGLERVLLACNVKNSIRLL